MKKRIVAAALCAVFVFSGASLMAKASGDDKGDSEERMLKFQVGIKASDSTGTAPNNFYYKPFAGVMYTLGDLKITPTYYRYQSYQITNGSGSYADINFNQLGAGVEYYFTDTLVVNFDYYYSFGENSYKGHDVAGDLSYDLNDAFTIILGYKGKFEQYQFLNVAPKPATEIVNTTHSPSLELDYSLTDTTTLDLSDEITVTTYDLLGYSYLLNNTRAGVMTRMYQHLMLMAGLNVGFDSSKYTIVGPDVALSYKLFNMIKLSASYLVQYNLAPSAVKGKNATLKKNPFLNPAKEGTSFWAQTLGFGVTLEF